jgi:hypothetical protein
MSLLDAIKRAAARAHVSTLPHENPAPVVETTVATVVPAVPDEDSGAHAAQEAGRIHRQLTEAGQQSQYTLDGETRRRIVESLNRFGPPRNAFLENPDTGALRTLDGKPVEGVPLQMPVRVRDVASDGIAELLSPIQGPAPKYEPVQPVTGADRRMTRAEYLEYKRARKETR